VAETGNGNGRTSIWLPTAVGVLTFISAGLGVWAVRFDSMYSEMSERVSSNSEQHARIEERVEGQAQMLARLRQQILDLDTTLQREMRILDDTASTRVGEMDRRLQLEQRLLLDTVLEKIRAMERVVFTEDE
jgi:hypothetical protein